MGTVRQTARFLSRDELPKLPKSRDVTQCHSLCHGDFVAGANSELMHFIEADTPPVDHAQHAASSHALTIAHPTGGREKKKRVRDSQRDSVCAIEREKM